MLNARNHGLPEVLGWNIAFLKGERQSWWDWLTHEDYRHVVAFGWGNGRWIVYDVANTRSRLHVLDDIDFDYWQLSIRERATAIINFPTQAGGDTRARVGLWCVTAVKHLLGIKSSALRPKALFRDLIDQGGKVIFTDDKRETTQGKRRSQSSA